MNINKVKNVNPTEVTTYLESCVQLLIICGNRNKNFNTFKCVSHL